MPVTKSITWVRGDAIQMPFHVINQSNQPVNVTGYTFDFVVRHDQLGTILLALELGTGIAITTAASGIVTVTVTATQTESFAAGDYFYAFRQTMIGAEATLTFGKLTIVHSAAVPAP